MIGEDGVMDMVEIFATETRRRLQRLTADGQDIATQTREMHTLKGAAGTVAAPRLTALGHQFEQAGGKGIALTRTAIDAIEPELEAYLASVRVWARRRQLVD
jgi:HPt (histidine-containing phosphotransfer) domain-containing protein